MTNPTDSQVEALLAAAVHGNVEEVTRLLDSGVDVDSTGERGWSSLHLVASNNTPEVARLLLEAGADKEALTTAGSTPLHLTARGDSDEVASLLLEAGAEKDSHQGKHAWTPLHQAASNNSPKVARLLLEAGADKEVLLSTGITPLFLAAEVDSGEVASLLLEAGAEKDSHQGKHAWTPLHRAACSNSPKVARLLLESGVDKEALTTAGSTALTWAAHEDSYEVASLLLEAGAEKDFRQGEHAWTSLHIAASNNSSKVVQLLLETGADKEVRNTSGWTPLHLAAFNDSSKSVASLIEFGAELKVKTNTGKSSLQLAIEAKSHSATEELIKVSDCEDISQPWGKGTWGNDQVTILHRVIQLGWGGVVMYLMGSHYFQIIRREDPNYYQHIKVPSFDDCVDKNAKTIAGNSPLHTAVWNNLYDMAHLLIGENVDIDAQTNTGNTALHIAIWNGNLDIIRLLSQNKANLNLKTQDGFSPIDTAISRGRIDIAMDLVSRGASEISFSGLPNFDELISKTAGWNLHEAARENREDIVRLLIESGTDPDQKPDYKLNEGAREEKGALKDRESESALCLAIRYKSQAAAEVLIEMGADILHDPDQSTSGTPLDLAIHDGNIKIAQQLADKGALGNHQEYADRYLADAVGENSVAIGDLLFDKNAELITSALEEYLPWQEAPPLFVAAGDGSVEMVRWLVEKGAEINRELPINDMGGKPHGTVLDQAVGQAINGSGNHRQIVEYLISQGADKSTHDLSFIEDLGPISPKTDMVQATLGNSVETDPRISTNSVNVTLGNEPSLQQAATRSPAAEFTSEPVNEPEKQRYSFSRLDTFQKCKKNYWFRYIEKKPDNYDGIEAFAGTVAHSTLEWMYRRRDSVGSPTASEVKGSFSESWEVRFKESSKEIRTVKIGTPTDHHRKELGDAVLRYFHSKFLPDRSETLMLEGEVLMDISDAEYTGFIDRVAKSGSSVTVTDYKSRQGHEKLLQLQGYGAAYIETHRTERADLVFEFLVDGTEKRQAFTSAGVRDVKADLQSRISRVRDTTSFDAAPSMLCHWCSYNNDCSEFKSSSFSSRQMRFRG